MSGGGAVAGVANGRHKLNEAQVLTIRESYANLGMRVTDLAELFDVSEGAIRMIVNRKTWKHI